MLSSGTSGCSSAPPPPLLLRRSPPPLRFLVKPSSYNLRHAGAAARASMVDNSSSFVKRMELAWFISQQPDPVPCSSCESSGTIECKWCRGTGFFILGDNMLCEVPSKNTTCKICVGKGSTCCTDCKGTGYRAKWLEQPPPPTR